VTAHRGVLGLAGYARVFCALAEPMTKPQLIGTGLLGKNAALRFVRALHEAGHIRVCAWDVRPHQAPLPVWLAQPRRLGDAPCPTKRDNGRAIRFHHPVASPQTINRLLHVFVQLLDALAIEPHSIGELARLTGCDDISVRKCLRALAAGKAVRVADWIMRRGGGGGAPVPQYALGRGPVARRPPRTPRKEINRRFREKAARRAQFWPLEQALMRMSANQFLQEAA